MWSVAMTLISAAAGAAEVPPLWPPGTPVPNAAETLPLDNAVFHLIKAYEPDTDGFFWLHGVALAWHRDRLYASFGHNTGAENTASEVAHGRVSEDNGATWGPVFTIDEGDEPGLAVSHGVFLEHEGRLWAFHGAFYGSMERVHTRAYVLNDASGAWERKGIVIAGGFWPMQEPQRLADGNFIMAGIRVANGYGGTDDPAAVAISHGGDLTLWDLVVIPKPPEIEMWGESCVIVGPREILNIARFGEPVALVAVSSDSGRTWTESRRSVLPLAASKPYAGVLSNGQHYLIGATTADSGNRRAPLTIAVNPPGETTFRRIYRIRDAVHDGPGESGPYCSLAYPYAVEHGGMLFVGYSNDGGRGKNRNSAELAVIPVAALASE